MSISPDCNYRGDAMSITNKLNQIKNAIYGKEVRGAIHDAIKQVYDDASVNHDNANMEVKMARGIHNTLNDRLDNVDEIQAQTNAQLSEKNEELVLINKKIGSEINVKYPPLPLIGAVADGTTDDSIRLQSIIDYIKSSYDANDYTGKINTLIFPEGVYRIENQLEIPPFIHLKSIGMVEIHSYVENDSCIWFNTKSDPEVSGYNKDWFRGKTAGYLIDGAVGGFFLKNKCGTSSYEGVFAKGDNKGAIGLEVGDRQKVYDTSLMAHYSFNNIRIELFHIGLKLNSVVNYIGAYNNLRLAFNDLCIDYGATTGLDSGENINFNNCTMSNSKSVLRINDNNNIGIFLNFNNCSIDYNMNMILNKNRGGAVVRFRGCHIEGIYTKPYYIINGLSLKPLEEDCFGMVKNVAGDWGCALTTTFTDTLISMTRGSGQAFVCSRFGENVVSFESVQLYCLRNNSENYMEDEWKFLCDEKTVILKKDIQYILDRKGFFLQKRLSIFKQPAFENCEIKKYPDSSKIGDFIVENTNGIHDYDVVNLSQNKNLLQANIKSSAETATFYLRSETMPVKTGNAFVIELGFRFVGNLTISVALFDKNSIKISNALDFNFESTNFLKWHTLNNRSYIVVKDIGFNENADVRITFNFKSNKPNMLQVSDIYFYQVN